jgi:hypothetical protein
LAKLCKDEGLDGPHYNNGKVQVDGVTFRAPGQIQDESGELVTTFFSGGGDAKFLNWIVVMHVSDYCYPVH